MVDPISENIRELLTSNLSSDEKENYVKYMRLQYEKSTKKMRDGSYEEFLTNNEQVKAHWDSIKNIPLTAIISGTDNKEPVAKTIVETQKQLAAISSKSKVVEVTNSTTYMAFNETETIIQEILGMLNKVKEKK